MVFEFRICLTMKIPDTQIEATTFFGTYCTIYFILVDFPKTLSCHHIYLHIYKGEQDITKYVFHIPILNIHITYCCVDNFFGSSEFRTILLIILISINAHMLFCCLKIFRWNDMACGKYTKFYFKYQENIRNCCKFSIYICNTITVYNICKWQTARPKAIYKICLQIQNLSKFLSWLYF